MSGVTGDFGKLEHLIKKLEELATPAARLALSKCLAEEYRSFMEECFHEGHSPYGQPWKPLSFRHSVGGGSAKPLADTGLMKSASTPFHVDENGFHFLMGKVYASTHQYGAVIKPKNAKALRFRGGVAGAVGGKLLSGTVYVRRTSASGRVRTNKYQGGFIFRKSVTIPARPYAPINGIPPELDARFQEAADEFIRDHFEE